MSAKISEDRIQIFESYPIPKAILTMSIPTVITSLVMMLYNLADTYFVGLLNDPVETAAVSLAAPLLLAFNAITNLLGVGGSSLFARCLGSKEYEKVRYVTAFSIISAILSAAAFSTLYLLLRDPILSVLGADADTLSTTAQYLFWTVALGAVPSILNVVLGYMVRSEGYSLQAGIGTMSGCILNMILDPIFILPWGLNMGAAGAGCATMLCNTTACLYFFLLLFLRRRKTLISINPLHYTWKKEIVLDIFSVGIPASIQNLLNVTGMTVLNNFAAAFGADAVAAIGISHKMSMVPLYIAMGVSQGIMPLISYNYAAKNGSRTRGVILTAGIFCAVFMSVMTTLFCIFSAPITGFFIQTPSIIAYGSRFLVGMSLAMPFLCIDFLGVAVFQACGLGKYSFVFAILRKIALEIPALFILNYLFPLYGLAYAQLCAEFILCFAAIIVLRKILRSL